MARKSLDQLSPAYRRRIERALAKGKTLQQARGHKAREHVYRQEREIEEYGVATSQRDSISRWYMRYNSSGKKELDLEDILDWVRENGYAAFQQFRETWNAARRTYVQELKAGTYASRGLPYLEMLAESAGTPEASWLYYH